MVWSDGTHTRNIEGGLSAYSIQGQRKDAEDGARARRWHFARDGGIDRPDAATPVLKRPFMVVAGGLQLDEASTCPQEDGIEQGAVHDTELDPMDFQSRAIKSLGLGAVAYAGVNHDVLNNLEGHVRERSSRSDGMA